MRNFKPILLVEDDDIDAMAAERSLEELRVTNPLVRVNDGASAMEYLRGAGTKKPCIILLDMSLPGMSGIEFLKSARTEGLLEKIPVIVLTASKDEQRIVESFELSVAGYVVKGRQQKELQEILGTINRYWTFSELPCGE